MRYIPGAALQVIHLVQHIAGQRMSTQLAEHHGSFATYLLMLAVGRREGMGDLYFPGELEWEGSMRQ